MSTPRAAVPSPRRPAPAHLLLALLALVGGACRSGQGEPCRCASDCKNGLECFAEGEGSLEGDACFKAGVRGTCIIAASLDTDGGTTMLDPMPVYEDIHSKRDLAPGGSDSATGTTATTDATGTGTTSTTGTGTETTGTTTTGSTGTSTTGTSTTDTSTTSTTGTSTTGTSTTGTSTTGTSTTDTSTTDTSTTTGGSTT